MSEFKQIKRTTVTEQVAEQIRNLIQSGQFKPGDKLPSQKELEQMMRVSRPTLREAISRLISEEMLEARQGQGYYVKQPKLNVNIQCALIHCDTQQMHDLFEARLFFESFLAQIAAVSATEHEISSLQCYMTRLETGTLLPEEKACDSNHIHRLISECTHNPFLIQFEQSLLELAAQTPQLFLSETRKDYQKKYETDPHRRIIDAIAQRDPRLAFLESFRHILNYTNDISLLDKYNAFI